MRSDWRRHRVPSFPAWRDEQGLATLIALTALVLLGLLALYSALGAAIELRISDNYESRVRADAAARAGLHHARDLLRGLDPDALLAGPDGAHDGSAAYLARARTHAFRNPIDWAAARALNVAAPAIGGGDDGLLNTGAFGGVAGTVLIPAEGIAQIEPAPSGQTAGTLSRYFVKVSDNNGEASELAGDPANDPFVDGDGLFLIRSMGVAPLLGDRAGASLRANSVSVYEGRFRFRTTFDLDAALVVVGDRVLPSAGGMFLGTGWLIDGGAAIGLGTVDPDPANADAPAPAVLAELGAQQRGAVLGAGLVPSVAEIGATVRGSGDKLRLLDPAYLADFVAARVPAFADATHAGGQVWSAGIDLGALDPAKPAADPAQRPRVTLVAGDLSIAGDLTGGGLLVVAGRLSGSGSLVFDGLILVLGSADADLAGLGLRLRGGLLVAGTGSGGVPPPTPRVSVGPRSRLVHERRAIRMALRLIPPSQVSVREVTTTLDP